MLCPAAVAAVADVSANNECPSVRGALTVGSPRVQLSARRGHRLAPLRWLWRYAARTHPRRKRVHLPHNRDVAVTSCCADLRVHVLPCNAAPTAEQKSWGCGTKHEDPGCG